MMMKKKFTVSHGGARPGAGRPAGSRNRLTIDREQLASEAAARFQAAGIANSELTAASIASMEPLQIMSYAMTARAMAGDWHGAAMLAKEIAPYRHAKLTSTKIDATVRRIEDMSDAELETLVSRYGDDDDAEGEAAD